MNKEIIAGVVLSLPIFAFGIYVNIAHPFRCKVSEGIYTTQGAIVTPCTTKCIKKENKMVVEHNTEIVQEPLISNEVELLARVIYAEAGNQDRVGKILVADVILNRCEADDFPNSIVDVISQAHQFETYSTGAIWKYDLDDSCVDVALQEMEAIRRYDENVLYFRTRKYHTYGTPAFKHQDHYFNY